MSDDNGWVRAWLAPGSELASGGVLPPGRFGIRLDGDVELTGTAEDLNMLGDQITGHFASPRVTAVADVADVFDGIHPGEGIGFAALTCGEADTLARMLALFGHHDTAANVLAGHALDDDCGDRHGYIHERHHSSEAERDEAAEVYLRRLMGDHDAQPADADAKRAELDRLVEQHTEQPDDDIADLIRQLRQELGEPVDLDI